MEVPRLSENRSGKEPNRALSSLKVTWSEKFKFRFCQEGEVVGEYSRLWAGTPEDMTHV